MFTSLDSPFTGPLFDIASAKCFICLWFIVIGNVDHYDVYVSLGLTGIELIKIMQTLDKVMQTCHMSEILSTINIL